MLVTGREPSHGLSVLLQFGTWGHACWTGLLGCRVAVSRDAVAISPFANLSHSVMMCVRSANTRMPLDLHAYTHPLERPPVVKSLNSTSWRRFTYRVRSM